MNITTKFDLFETVFIKALEIEGTVIEFIWMGTENLYKVEAWWEGEKKIHYLRESEIVKTKPMRDLIR